MSGTHTYHDVPQALRIQKRLVLNQCFKSVRGRAGIAGALNCVTYGGRDLYDVMDLVAVFDIREHRLNIISYEENEAVAEASRVCPVAANLSRIATVSVAIVPTVFFENPAPLVALRESGPFIYFLDDTRTFREGQAETLLQLARDELLRPGDYLLITSCLTPRIVHQPSFMSRFEDAFKLYYRSVAAVDTHFKVRNHVDLLVAHTLSRHQSAVSGRGPGLRAQPLRKFRYRDTRAAMGLWLYHIVPGEARASPLADLPFEEFPHAFAVAAEDVPNIFD
jgi:hypothetical protein